MRRRRSLPRNTETRPSTSAQHPVRPPLTRTLTDTDTNNLWVNVKPVLKGVLRKPPESSLERESWVLGSQEHPIFFVFKLTKISRAWLILEDGCREPFRSATAEEHHSYSARQRTLLDGYTGPTEPAAHQHSVFLLQRPR